MNRFLDKLAKMNFKRLGIGFIIISVIALLGAGTACYIDFGSRINDREDQNIVNEAENATKATTSLETEDANFEDKSGGEAATEVEDANANDTGSDETASEGEDSNQQQKRVDYKGIFERDNGRGEFENIHRDSHEIEFDKILNLNTGDKVIIVITGIIIALISAAYWILIILWLVRRAYLDGANYVLFGFGALFLNLAAVIAYYLYRSFTNRCPSCGKMQKKDIEFCTNCGEAVNTTCSNCGARIHKKDSYCGKCGTKQ